ncbi:MAG: AMP-binding protein [Actinomycetota bacterium]|nr:AMP-binding protein [Actinomycetota bacterium]
MANGSTSESTTAFRAARDFLQVHREDYTRACQGFRWPHLESFNYATDWFDVLAAEHGGARALCVIEEDGSESTHTFAEMSALSQRFAGFLKEAGVGPGDRVLLMLGNCAPLWVAMLGCIRLGAVMIPATTLLSGADLTDRLSRGQVRAALAGAADTATFGPETESLVRVSVGAVEGWLSYEDAVAETVTPHAGGDTAADDPLLLYFTSGTTATPKLVEHTQTSYPIGHLSTMYWIGLQPGDLHLNISSPGWAKHAWSCFFAPWNAGATVVVYNYSRFDASALLDVMERVGVTTFCAPPTVWRMITRADDLGSHRLALRECVAAGEPLNRDVIEQVRRVWGLTVRDGFGQTETAAQIGNSPGQRLVPGSMGRPLPGYTVALVDLITGEVGTDGEICLELARRPLGLMTGYRDDPELTAEVLRGGFYHTGDVASRAEDGYITYVGRSDDVFKASDYRISPFELESVLTEHPAVAEAAVVPSPDPVRLAVPKAFVALAGGHAPTAETAYDILRFTRSHLAPYQRIRRIEFSDLPKTVSGKIRRVELRAGEAARVESGERCEAAFSEDDFPDLAS